MKQNVLVERLAATSRTSPGAAADQLERIVHEIMQSLKEGRPAALPGLGTFTPVDSKSGFRFEAEPRKPVRLQGRK